MKAMPVAGPVSTNDDQAGRGNYSSNRRAPDRASRCVGSASYGKRSSRSTSDHLSAGSVRLFSPMCA